LGGALLTLGRGKEAIESYRHAIDRDATRAGAWASLGVSLCSIGEFREALPNFERALALDSANADARFYYARALDAAGDRAGALAQIGTLLTQNPGHAEGLALRAELEAATK
jgi:tetratricopeptide (TPR) repeat protein